MKQIVPFLLAASPVLADDAFLEANILGIFYHELGHAIIHIEDVPVFGQEEDAADVFSIFLIDALYEPDVAESIAYDAALGFWAEAETRGDDIAWWDVHGPDEQRFFNTVCLFFGADPDRRDDFATDLDLPEERADYCPEEYDQANAAWGPVLEALWERGKGDTLVFSTKSDSLTSQVLQREIEALNAEMSLSYPLQITLDSCGEANAFYAPDQHLIVFCTEFEAHLKALAKQF